MIYTALFLAGMLTSASVSLIAIRVHVDRMSQTCIDSINQVEKTSSQQREELAFAAVKALADAQALVDELYVKIGDLQDALDATTMQAEHAQKDAKYWQDTAGILAEAGKKAEKPVRKSRAKVHKPQKVV